ncbi:MAG: hypothetical protein MZV70_59855 [Desulfobacterales bacterium]|nr:hypothetical protein [Desulfobacterales bacterium]
MDFYDEMAILHFDSAHTGLLSLIVEELNPTFASFFTSELMASEAARCWRNQTADRNCQFSHNSMVLFLICAGQAESVKRLRDERYIAVVFRIKPTHIF